MSEFQPAPTWADVILTDEVSHQTYFNPIWLNWFLDLVQLINGGGGSGFGTVTSVGLIAPGIFSVSGSPVTASGNLVLDLVAENAHFVWIGPTSGGPAVPSFRALVLADLPALPGVPDPLLLGNGTVTAPTYSFTSDPNTGLYRFGSDILAFTVGGVLQWLMNSAGSLYASDAAGSANGALRTITGQNGGAGGGTGGAFTAAAGNAQAGNDFGGDAALQGGQSAGAGDGGRAQVTGGFAGGAGTGGEAQIIGGSSSTGNGGTASLRPGTSFFGGVVGNTEMWGGGGEVFRVNGVGNHGSWMGGTPSISAGGGTGPSLVGTDQAFTVTIGTGGVATSFTVTFSSPFVNAPVPSVISNTDLVAFTAATTTSTIVVTAAAAFTAGSKVHVQCASWE